MNKRKGMPSKINILQARYQDMWDMPDNEYEAKKTWLDTCWACGFAGHLQRCHLKSAQDGGSNDSKNLVLLCRSCHVRQETECATDEGRQNFVAALQDGALYMSIRMQELAAQIERMTEQQKQELIKWGEDKYGVKL